MYDLRVSLLLVARIVKQKTKKMGKKKWSGVKLRRSRDTLIKSSHRGTKFRFFAVARMVTLRHHVLAKRNETDLSIHRYLVCSKHQKSDSRASNTSDQVPD